MDLAPRSADQRPLYLIQVLLRSRCDPTATLPIDSVEAVREFGQWGVMGAAVWLKPDKASSYFVPVEQPPVAE
jgi:hypothetical protein